VMGQSGNDDARKTRHAAMVARRRYLAMCIGVDPESETRLIQ
jgi:hypothetical protein